MKVAGSACGELRVACVCVGASVSVAHRQRGRDVDGPKRVRLDRVEPEPIRVSSAR